MTAEANNCFVFSEVNHGRRPDGLHVFVCAPRSERERERERDIVVLKFVLKVESRM